METIIIDGKTYILQEETFPVAQKVQEVQEVPRVEGFYKLDGEDILYAPNFVKAPNFTLLKEDKDTYEYPKDGWYWFNTEEEAKNSLI
jgi:hypothetical protein